MSQQPINWEALKGELHDLRSETKGQRCRIKTLEEIIRGKDQELEKARQQISQHQAADFQLQEAARLEAKQQRKHGRRLEELAETSGFLFGAFCGVALANTICVPRGTPLTSEGSDLFCMPRSSGKWLNCFPNRGDAKACLRDAVRQAKEGRFDDLDARPKVVERMSSLRAITLPVFRWLRLVQQHLPAMGYAGLVGIQRDAAGEWQFHDMPLNRVLVVLGDVKEMIDKTGLSPVS